MHLMLTKFIQVFASVNEQQSIEPFTVVFFVLFFVWLIEMRYEKKKTGRIYSIFSISIEKAFTVSQV